MPGRSRTVFKFSLPVTANVRLSIYNVIGQLMRTLVDGKAAAGTHEMPWNGRAQTGEALAAGVYFYQLVVKDHAGNTIFTQTHCMMMLK